MQKDAIIALMKNSHSDNPSDAVVMLQILFGMLSKRIELYPDDDRIIMDFWFETENGRNHLQVESIIPDAKKT